MALLDQRSVVATALWFVTAEPVLLEALRRAHAGENPDVIAAELYARAGNPADALCRVLEIPVACREADASG